MSRTLFFTVRLVGGKGKPESESNCNCRNRAKIRQSARRRFCWSHAGSLFIRIREVRTIRGSHVCFREARRSAVSSTVSTRVLARASAATVEREIIFAGVREREEEIVSASCIFVSRMISVFLLCTSFERERETERGVYFTVVQRLNFASVIN